MDLKSYLERMDYFATVSYAKLELLIPHCSMRTDIAARCLHLSLEHHASICVLTGEELFGSAFALLRLQAEAYLRGSWVHLCASEESIQKFAEDESPPSPKDMIDSLEKAHVDYGEGQLLSVFYADHWSELCSFTHGGGLHLQRRSNGLDVTSAYPENEVMTMLNLSNSIALITHQAFARLADQPEVDSEVLCAFRELEIPNK